MADTRLPVKINGRPYQLLISPDFQRGSPTSQRPTLDNSPEASGGSIATGIAWRRSQSDWSGGAGQKYFDEDSPTSVSDRTRFFRSVGVDIWSRRQLGMLRACTAVALTGSAPTMPKFAALPDQGTYGWLYMSTATGSSNIRRFVLNGASAPTAANISGSTGKSYSIATDGSSVYAACDNGVFSVSGVTATILASVSTVAHSFVTVANGRLIAAKATGELYEYSSTGTTVTTFAGMPAGTVWRAGCGAPKAILVSGSLGRVSTLYRVTYNETSGGLNVALTPATDFPHGEIIYALAYHMGFLLIGTSRGVRIGTIDESGNVIYGPVITAPGPVYDFSAEDRYVWFAWQTPASSTVEGALFDYSAVTNGDSPAGTGRLDLGNLVLPLQPAYTTDITETGGVLGASTLVSAVARINGRTWFAADTVGSIFHEDDSARVLSGWVDSSLIEYGFEGEKIGCEVEVRHTSGDGLIGVTIETEDGAETFLGTLGTSGSFQSDAPIPVPSVTSEGLRLRFDLQAATANGLGGDVPVSWWKMQEPSGTTATDAEALHNGTYSGVAVNQPGPGTNLPKAVTFDTTDTMIVGDFTDYEPAGAFSLEAWVKFGGVNSNDANSLTIGKWQTVGSGPDSFCLLCYSNTSDFGVSVFLVNGTVVAASLDVAGITAGWHHIAVAFVPLTSVKVYVDGILAGTTLTVTPFTSASTPQFKLGGSDNNLTAASLSRSWDVAGLAFYNYALSDVSVAAHFDAVDQSTFDAFLRRWALRAVPVARSYEVITCPLQLFETVDVGGEQYAFDTLAEYGILLALKQARTIVPFEMLGQQVQIVIDEVTLGNVDNINWQDGEQHHFNGTLLVKCWTV